MHRAPSNLLYYIFKVIPYPGSPLPGYSFWFSVRSYWAFSNALYTPTFWVSSVCVLALCHSEGWGRRGESVCEACCMIISIGPLKSHLHLQYNIIQYNIHSSSTAPIGWHTVGALLGLFRIPTAVNLLMGRISNPGGCPCSCWFIWSDKLVVTVHFLFKAYSFCCYVMFCDCLHMCSPKHLFWERCDTEARYEPVLDWIVVTLSLLAANFVFSSQNSCRKWARTLCGWL